MNDVDDPLRGYRPLGPPPELRAGIVSDAERTRTASLRDWLPALATAALIALLYIVATGIRARAYTQILDIGAAHEVEVSSP